MGNKYEIIEGDCLERIARRLGISVAQLQAMNSDQIKNVDLIYAGNLLNIPETDGPKSQEKGSGTATGATDPIKPASVSAERIQLPELPEMPDSVCEPKEYVDVVFYPSMPKTGEQGWFALTQDAADALQQEIGHMRGVMQTLATGDVNDAMLELSKYGILSKFQSSDHERFLEKDDDKKRYRALLFLQLALKLEAVNLPEILFSGAQKNSAESQELLSHYHEAYANQILWENCENLLKITVNGIVKTSVLGGFTEGPFSDLKVNYREIRESAIDDVMEQLADEIEKLEKKARKEASKKLSDDGTPFTYSESMGYFTSKQQNTIHAALNAVHKARGMYSLELEDIYKDKPESILRRLELWQQDSKLAVRLTPYEFRARFAGRFVPILTLNTNLMVLIEQCLTDEELINVQPETFKYYEALDESAEKKLIEEVFSRIPGLKDMTTVPGEALPWSYYPCIAVLHKLEASLKTKLAELKDILGVGKLPKEVLGDLVQCKKALLARVEHFEKTAKAHAAAGEYQRLFTPADKIYTPVFKEKAWQPAKKTGSLYTQAGKADLTVVECYLISEGGKTAFIRGPSWLVPEDSDGSIECGDHIIDLKPGLKVAEADLPTVGPQIQIEGMEPIPKPETVAEEKPTFLETCVKAYIAELAKETPVKLNLERELIDFDKAAMGKLYHWKPNGPEINGVDYHVSAECQFLRFSSAVTLGDEMGVDTLWNAQQSGTIAFSAAEAKATLNLAQGQTTLTVKYPNATGHPLVIDYVADLPAHPLKIEREAFYKADRKKQVASFNGGRILLDGAFTLYGMVGASINLSAGVEFGNLDQGGVGVKGFTESYQDYNAYRKDIAQIKNADGELLMQSKAVDATASAGVFAGVEVGGEFVGSLKWQPPGKVAGQLTSTSGADKNGFVSFGQFTAKAAAAFAASASGVIKLTVSGGKIIFIMAARLALGPGVSGKLGFEISPLAINDFIDHILTIMNKEGFRRLNLFDESIDPDSGENSFELFNMFLTAVMVTGLKAADVLLLPFEKIKEFNDESTREKLAPVLADFINEDAEKALPWVKKMPPETMGRLLFTLCDAQSYSLFERVGDLIDTNENRYSSADFARNVRQRNAIQRIIAWLSESIVTRDMIKVNRSPIEKNIRFFEEAIVRMNEKGSKPATKVMEWQAYLSNARLLMSFHSVVSRNEVDSTQDLIDERIRSFKEMIAVMSKNYLFYAKAGVWNVKYYAFYVADCDRDSHEQKARMEAVGIHNQLQPVSIMSIKGIS